MKILKRLMVLFLSTGLVLNASLPSIAEVDHSTPMLWTVMESGTTEHLNGIWGSASNHIFAVGDNGTILYYDGTSWSTVASPVSGDINAIWGRSASEIYAVGDSGILIEFNGVEWDTSGAIPHPTGIVSDVFGSSTETFCALYGTLDGSPGGGAVMKRYPNWECRESELFCEIDDRPCNDARTNDRLNTIYVQESTDYVYVGGYRYISDRPVVGVRRN